MWSKKAAAVAGGAIFLTLAGLIRLNYLFISAGLVMLTFVVISSFLDVWMPNVRIRRETTSDNIFEDGTMSVKFIIKNTNMFGIIKHFNISYFIWFSIIRKVLSHNHFGYFHTISGLPNSDHLT